MKPDKLVWITIAIGCLIIIGFLGAGAYMAYNNPKPARELPYFKPLGNDTLLDSKGQQVLTPRYHQVLPFRFLNQHGDTISQRAMTGKIALVDFFFTTCQSICPKMTTSLAKLAAENKTATDLIILSHTVDPETDTVAQMAQYAETYKITLPLWHLLTGSKTALYKIARESYFLDAHVGDGGANDFIHTQMFALIDKEGHIRGYYDGTDEKDMQRLRTDLGLLRQYYAWDASNKVAF